MARDHFGLLVLALVIPVPLIVAGGAVILAIMDKRPLLIRAGAALLGVVGGEMLVPDQALEDRFGRAFLHSRETTAAVTFALVAWAIGWLMRRRRFGDRIEGGAG